MKLTSDKLWKAIFEDFFPEAFAFYFPAFFPMVDWSRGFEMLDKEQRQIFPESIESHRRVDLLLKVWLLDGAEQWILTHIEVQGYRDLDFPHRMFVYFYRLTDRFKVPISALAVLTDSDKDWRPDRYFAQFMDTRITYEYPVYKLADYSATDFEGSDNPWALVMKTALTGLNANWDDASLMKIKIGLYREFRDRGFSIEKTRTFLQFLKYYVRFEQNDFYGNFDREIQIVDNQKESPMGMLELVKQHLIEEAREEGIEKGIEEGMEKGIEKGIEKGMTKGQMLKTRRVTVRFIEKYPDFTDEAVAEIVEVTVKYIKQVRREMQQKKK